MSISKEPYWSLEDGNRPWLSEFEGRSREVVVFRMGLPEDDTAKLEGQYGWRFSETTGSAKHDMQVIDPLREMQREIDDAVRLEEVRLELKRMIRI